MSLRYFFIIFSLLFFLPSAEAAEPEASSAPRFKLGAIVPLSGPLSFFGQDYVRAHQLASEAVPSLKDTIEVVWEDSGYDPKKAIAAFKKLVSVDRVDVIWSFGGPMLNALAPLAEAEKIPFFATESAKSDCENRKFCSLFRNEEDEWGKATWQILRKRNMQKIGIAKNQNQFMDTFVSAIIRNKQGNETVEVVFDVPPETSDLRSNTLALKSKSFDALGFYLLPASHHGLLTSLRDLNVNFPLFGVEEFLVKEHNKDFQKLIDGALVIAPGATESYRAEFEKRFGESAGFFYTPAFYDFLVLLKDTKQNKGSLRGLALVDALHFSGEREGVSGKFSVKSSKNGVFSYSFPIFVYRIAGEKVIVEEVINL